MEKAFLSTTGIPVGTILAFAGEQNRIPNGWLLCDGRQVSRYDLPKLFEAIGAVWGGSATPNFFLPDLRGMFLRGVSGESNADPDRSERSPSQVNNGGNKGNLVGSIQPDAFRSHNHPVNPGNAFMNNDGTSNSVDGGGNVNYTRSTLSTSLVGGSETRPVNAYVHYIIKVDD